MCKCVFVYVRMFVLLFVCVSVCVLSEWEEDIIICSPDIVCVCCDGLVAPNKSFMTE